jgi:hypothetical protein
MFCIIPVNGMEFRLSWQLASLWLGGAAFALFLTSWWWRAFWLIALIRTATMPPAYDAYISLLTIAVFLAAAEGFRRIAPERVMNAMCVAAILLFAWVMAQKFCGATAWFAPRMTGPFNPDSGGVFFALCLPAFLRPRWWPFGIICFAGIVMAGTTTGALAAIAALGVFLFIWEHDAPHINRRIVADAAEKDGEMMPHRVPILPGKRILAGAAALVVLLGLWFWRVDPLADLVGNKRWIAWKHAAWSMRSGILGRGLGSFKTAFPLLSSGDARIGEVKNEAGKITMSNVFLEAHNEYVQAAFELGIQMVVLMVLFAIGTILTRQVPAYIAAGMAALMVACAGWHVFHVAPLALLGCAWLGLWERKVGMNGEMMQHRVPIQKRERRDEA